MQVPASATSNSGLECVVRSNLVPANLVTGEGTVILFGNSVKSALEAILDNKYLVYNLSQLVC